MIQDCNPSSSRLSSSDHVFLASGFLATTLLFPLVRSLPVWSPLSLPGHHLHIVDPLPDLVCMVRPVARGALLQHNDVSTYLDCIFDNKLKWTKHLEHVISKARKRLSISKD
ncbi:hypothetical protein TNCV_1258401 [Trichonephila clavipes]|nr:hypothetical protein TNCV_1258401 [Trichonephila clavipes]